MLVDGCKIGRRQNLKRSSPTRAYLTHLGCSPLDLLAIFHFSTHLRLDFFLCPGLAGFNARVFRSRLRVGLPFPFRVSLLSPRHPLPLARRLRVRSRVVIATCPSRSGFAWARRCGVSMRKRCDAETSERAEEQARVELQKRDAVKCSGDDTPHLGRVTVAAPGARAAVVERCDATQGAAEKTSEVLPCTFACRSFRHTFPPF
ncbi:hypothetical protein K438DRAFT_1815031 [Mycena galopus ATCC 62051]|nr:hypothetical protein K438DRAFT_1815031 [Mycena galopus ATCC 62051]